MYYEPEDPIRVLYDALIAIATRRIDGDPGWYAISALTRFRRACKAIADLSKAEAVRLAERHANSLIGEVLDPRNRPPWED